MNDSMLVRQADIIPVNLLNKSVRIVGAGAVGSFVALTLSKMGFSDITVHDFDEVSTENLSCQFYRIDDIGFRKVDALKEIVADFSGTEIKTVPEKLESISPLKSDILIMAVDSMSARKLIWGCVESTIGGRPKIVLDPRMGAEACSVYVVDPNYSSDVDRYEKSLYSDENAIQERCTAKATMYTATMLSGMVCKLVKDFVVDQKTTTTVHWDIKANDMIQFN